MNIKKRCIVAESAVLNPTLCLQKHHQHDVCGTLLLHKPPWQQKIFSSIIAAMGRQLKQSVKVFQSFMLNLRLPEKKMKTRD